MKKIYLVLFVILSVFVFSCKDNLISDDLSSNQNSGAGQVKVFVKQSRLIGPDVSDVSWEVFLYKDNDLFSGKNENGYYLFSGLSDGTYNITVSGKIDDVEKFTGSAQVTIANGNSVSVNVPIVAKKTDKDYGDEKTGYATITMDMSGKLLSLLNSMGEDAIFEAQLYSVDGNDNKYITASLVKRNLDELDEIVSIEFLDNQKVEFVDNISSPIVTTENPIPTGYYYLTFSGLEQYGYTIKLKDNLVEIGNGLTTNIVLTQNDYEIVKYYFSVWYVNEDGTGDNATGSSLSDPIAFSKLNPDAVSRENLIYLLSDIELSIEEAGILCDTSAIISSFGSTVRTISANISDYSNSITLGYGTTLKNIKLSGSNAFSFESLNIDETVILDTPIAKNLDLDSDSVVKLDKSSKLVIGQKFSGELGICLSFEDWNIGDTVVTFENGVKPSNSNFYISEDADMPTGFASMFYIDDKGKLAQYDATSQWVNFAWNSGEPYLITQTQAKNKTYTSIYDNDGDSLFDFNGISTYDEENQTWYFIGRDESGNKIPYVVTRPDIHTSTVVASILPVDSIIFYDYQAIDYDDGKLYLVSKSNGYDFTIIDVNDKSLSYYYAEAGPFENFYTDSITSLLVYGNDFYIATTLTYTTQPVSTTHSAIWQLKLEQTDDGYNLSSTETYTDVSGTQYPVPYYQTQYDDNLAINSSFPENSTFRITDLYSDGNSVYGLLANYEDKVTLRNSHSDIHMRGSVFKLTTNSSRQENSAPIMNATHLGLRKSFPLTSENLATAKQDFILPRKIVGILNKKLVIVDDGMVPDVNEPNVDRFVLFDLAGEISETIDVAVPFSTNGVANTSDSLFYTSNSLFN